MKRGTSFVAATVLCGVASVGLPATANSAEVGMGIQVDCTRQGEVPVSFTAGDVVTVRYANCATVTLGTQPYGPFVLIDPLPSSPYHLYSESVTLPSPTGVLELNAVRGPSPADAEPVDDIDRTEVVMEFLAPGQVDGEGVSVVGQRPGTKLYDTTGASAEFVRSRTNCSAGTLTLHGIDPDQRMRVHYYSVPHGMGGALRGWKGGRGAEWSRYLDLTKPGWNTDDDKQGTARLPRRSFKMRIDFWWPSGQWKWSFQRIPACQQ